MKKILLALSILFLMAAMPAFSADMNTSKSLTFQWEQPVDLGYINGWSLYSSPTSGSGYEKVVFIPYVPGDPNTTFTTETVLIVTGPPGTTVQRYFVLTANGKGGLESVYSNEVSEPFDIPYPQPSAPFRLIIKGIAIPK